MGVRVPVQAERVAVFAPVAVLGDEAAGVWVVVACSEVVESGT
jgi:hypothetical protein